VEAAKLLGMTEVPVIRVSHLTETAIRAYMLVDNRLCEKAGYDRELLAIELGELALLLPQVNLDLSSTGFEPSEIDSILMDFEADRPDPADDMPPLHNKAAVARMGDLFVLGRHRILVGDARKADCYARLMRTETAVTAILDVPFNVKISGHVGGRGRIKHPEFACASGEMNAEQFTEFLEQSLRLCAQFSVDGAIHYVFMDWRHIGELLAAGRAVYTELKNLCVWTKNNAGQGSFYRSQHELVFVFKHGTASHLNTFELGQHGRTRSNVWPYAGVNSFRAGRLDELKMHPTVKPVALVVDALRDCSTRGDIVLDAFAGSGTTIIAAEQIGRRAFCMEIDPRYVDVCIRRWQAYTRRDAVLDGTRQTFDELAASRTASDKAAMSNPSRAATHTGADLGARPHRRDAGKRKSPSPERCTGKTLAKAKRIHSHGKARISK
jgi:DNA modification methylase